MTLKTIKTSTGKTIKDFQIPENLLKKHPDLVILIMQSSSMKDDERQYWFNLSEVMKPEQIQKLREILTREKTRLAEIDAKYGKKQKIDPVKAAKQAETLAKTRQKKQTQIQAKEKAHEDKEKAAEADILAELATA